MNTYTFINYFNRIKNCFSVIYAVKIKLPLVLCLFSFSISAQQASTNEPPAYKDSIFIEIPTIRILGKYSKLMTDIPGSAVLIEQKSIEALQLVSGNEVLRTSTGIHVLDEEGLGLRANIGIRGLDPDRSSKVLVLEDGIPVALAPYGEPQLYYTPAMDRMAGIEILKGSGQVLFGPQTIGGVINYLTADPPKESKGNAQLRVGEGGFFSSLLGYGNTIGQTGFQVNFLHKQGDEIGPTKFRLNDFTGKLNWQMGDKSKVGLKLGFYDEYSNSTYVGITQAMYDQGGQDFVKIAPDDRLDVRRISGSLTHEYKWSDHLKLQTTLFGYTTTRNWQRQDFSYSMVSNPTGVVWGDPSAEGGAIYMRDSNGHRNRQFEVAGLEPRLTYFYKLGKQNHKLNAGMRILYERAFEQRVNGKKAEARSGDLRDDEMRTGKAFSAFLQNQFHLTGKLSISGGLRMEHYHFKRDIHRLNYLDTSLVSSNSITQVIPGVGINYNWSKNWTLFAGIHRGFAPPRIKDAISNSGEVYELDPELSWNSEIGLRSSYDDFNWELTFFNMNFSNQIIPVSESSGGVGAGLVNGGSTVHRGIEVAASYIQKLGKQIDLTLSTDATLVDAYYNEDRYKENEEARINIKNNTHPYAPSLLLFGSLQLDSKFGWGTRFSITRIGEQYSDELNTETATNNGRTGKIPAYFVLDFGTQYHWKKINTTFSLSVKNLTNERYIVTRRPQGIRVGLPRFVSGGVKVSF